MTGTQYIGKQVIAERASDAMSTFELHSLIASYTAAIAALFAVFLGIYQLLKLRREAATREALEFARQESSSAEWLKIRAEFVEFIDKNRTTEGTLKAAAIAKSVEAMDDAVYAVLNRYEMLALAIKRRAVDELFMWDIWRYALSIDWAYLSQIVFALRENTGRSTLFCELEWLAKRWARPSFKPRELF